LGAVGLAAIVQDRADRRGLLGRARPRYGSGVPGYPQEDRANLAAPAGSPPWGTVRSRRLRTATANRSRPVPAQLQHHHDSDDEPLRPDRSLPNPLAP